MMSVLGQGAGHAKEGVPRAGGDVRRGARGVQVIRRFKSGDAESRTTGNS